MTKFAPVGPPKLLRNIRDQWGDEVLGDYHLVLAHDIVENKEDWRGTLPQSSTVILDNSFVELGNHAASVEMILRAYEVLQPEGFRQLVIVPPETFDDHLKTHLQFKDALDFIIPRVDPQVEFMYIIQAHDTGATDAAFLNFQLSSLVVEWEHWRRAKWIGIPRTITERMGTRAYTVFKALALKMLHHDNDLNVHLLGFSNNIRDDIWCCRLWGITGIDSAVPLRLGQQEKLLDPWFKGDQAGPRSDYWSHTKAKPDTHSNINHFRRLINRLNTPYDLSYAPSLKKDV